MRTLTEPQIDAAEGLWLRICCFRCQVQLRRKGYWLWVTMFVITSNMFVYRITLVQVQG